jgi:hypothetical protein
MGSKHRGLVIVMANFIVTLQKYFLNVHLSTSRSYSLVFLELYPKQLLTLSGWSAADVGNHSPS